MHLTRLALTDFRNYAGADVQLQPGVSVFTGGNGQGKTNLLEAAVYVATFGSHRVAADAPLIRSGAERAILRAAIATGPPDAQRHAVVEIELNNGRANRVRLNRVALPRPREAVGTLRCVLFAPEDIVIVKGDPDSRRRYLDDLLAATRPRFAGIRADYERVVRQRTALLKAARAQRAGTPAALEVWDEQLTSLGAELTAGRLDLMAALGPLVATAYAAVGGDSGVVTMTYRQAGQAAGPAVPGPDLPGPAAPVPADRDAIEAGLREALQRARRAELERAVCLVGPHRDQLELTIGDLPARGYASHGESWSLALALRVGAFDLLRSDGDDPVLLLDDVFAELDEGRRERLAQLVGSAEQVLVTAAVMADVPASLNGSRYRVSAGQVSDG